MVTYYPNGQMVPRDDVKKNGCPYGYVIQDIVEKNQVTQENNVLDDISLKKDDIKPKQKEINKRKKSNKKNSTKKAKKIEG